MVTTSTQWGRSLFYLICSQSGSTILISHYSRVRLSTSIMKIRGIITIDNYQRMAVYRGTIILTNVYFILEKGKFRPYYYIQANIDWVRLARWDMPSMKLAPLWLWHPVRSLSHSSSVSACAFPHCRRRRCRPSRSQSGFTVRWVRGVTVGCEQKLNLRRPEIRRWWWT